MTIEPFATDIFAEAESSDDTLANLGPLAPLAGSWKGTAGLDVHPQVFGPETNDYVETFDLQAIDPQTNGPQLFYGLRYHQHIVKPGEIEMFHEQVGFLLWEPAASTVIMTLAIPRGQVAMAGGTVSPTDKVFTLRATAGDPSYGIVSNPFLVEAFETTSWEITFRIGDDGTWGYEQTTMLNVIGQDESFAHRDSSVLRRTGPAKPNPLAGGLMPGQS